MALFSIIKVMSLISGVPDVRPDNHSPAGVISTKWRFWQSRVLRRGCSILRSDHLDRSLIILYRIDCRHRGRVPSSSAVSAQKGTAMATARLERRLSAILAADVVGYSRL